MNNESKRTDKIEILFSVFQKLTSQSTKKLDA